MDRGTVMAVRQTDGGEVKKMCCYSSFILKADLVVVNFSMGRRGRRERRRGRTHFLSCPLNEENYGSCKEEHPDEIVP